MRAVTIGSTRARERRPPYATPNGGIRSEAACRRCQACVNARLQQKKAAQKKRRQAAGMQRTNMITDAM